jgi:hypothetical protein
VVSSGYFTPNKLRLDAIDKGKVQTSHFPPAKLLRYIYYQPGRYALKLWQLVYEACLLVQTSRSPGSLTATNFVKFSCHIVCAFASHA